MTNLQIVSKNIYYNTTHSDKFTFASLNKIVIHQADCIKILSIDKIEFVQASSNYSIIHMIDGSKLVTSKTLKSVFKSLGSAFIRTHKSFVVNLKYIKEYRFRDSQITMESAKTVLVSRTNKALVKDVFSNS